MAMTPGRLQPRESETVIDTDWQRIIGLRCLAFIWTPYTDEEMRDRRRNCSFWGTSYESKGYRKPREGEITGIEGNDIYVVIDGEDEPRKVCWWDVRPR